MKYLILLILSINVASAQVSIGPFLALDQTKFSGELPENYEYVLSSGFGVGVITDAVLSKDIWLSLRPIYSKVNSDVAIRTSQNGYIHSNFNQIDTTFNYPITAHYVSLPVLVKVYVSKGFYANSGVDCSYNITAKTDILEQQIDISDRINRFLFSVVFGFGGTIPVGKTTLNFELTYRQGLNTITKKREIDDGVSPGIRKNGFRLATYFMIFNSKKTQ